MTPQEKYEQSLKSHDWYYEMSDDHGVWQRGTAERHALREMQKQVDPDWAIWNAHAPDMYQYTPPESKPATKSATRAPKPN